jgi:hypothetical protein
VSWLQHTPNRPCHRNTPADSLIKVVHTFLSHTEAWDESFYMLLQVNRDQSQLKRRPYVVSTEENVLPRKRPSLSSEASGKWNDLYLHWGTESWVPSACFTSSCIAAYGPGQKRNAKRCNITFSYLGQMPPFIITYRDQQVQWLSSVTNVKINVSGVRKYFDGRCTTSLVKLYEPHICT